MCADTSPDRRPQAATPGDQAGSPAVDGQSHLAGGAAAPGWGPPWVWSRHLRSQLDNQMLLVVAAMLVVGAVFFGYRAVISVGVVVAGAMLTYLPIRWALRRLNPARVRSGYREVMILGGLLGLCLPVMRVLALPLVAGLVLGCVAHAVGRTHRIRVHPVALVLVLVWLVPSCMVRIEAVEPAAQWLQSVDAVLRPERAVLGDVFDAGPNMNHLPWASPQRTDATDALAHADPYDVLVREQRSLLRHRPLMANLLVSGELAPMVDLLLGAAPGPVGYGCRLLTIVLGLYLMFRRQAWGPMALTAVLAAVAALLLLPLEYQGRWVMANQRLVALGPVIATTYLSYMLLAGPLLLIVLILAPAGAPMARPGRVIYGALIGVGVVALQWWVAAPQAAYAALVVAGLISRPLDALRQSPFVNRPQ